jgi:hypothetical protein
MTYTLEFREWTPAAEDRELVEHAIARVDQLVTRLSWEPVTLRVVVERNAPRTVYHVVLTLDVPGRTIVARGTARGVGGCTRGVRRNRARNSRAPGAHEACRRVQTAGEAAKLRDVT